MQIPDRAGVIVGYRVWRVIPGKWVDLSQSLSAQRWFQTWSLTEATVAHCPPRLQGDPSKPLLRRSHPHEAAPSFGCTCGLYARYEPIQEVHPLPYVVGSILAWGRVVHHVDHSFFRAEKALPVAFVRPHRGGGVFPHLAEDKFFRIADLLEAEVVDSPEELRTYSEVEVNKW